MDGVGGQEKVLSGSHPTCLILIPSQGILKSLNILVNREVFMSLDPSFACQPTEGQKFSNPVLLFKPL